MQGDIIVECPIVFWKHDTQLSELKSQQTVGRVIVMTQSCDLAQIKTERILVAIAHRVQFLVDSNILKPAMIRDQIRLHRVYGWYFLPAGPNVDESIVDLRDLHTLPRSLLQQLIQNGNLAPISTPFREHLAQPFATTYSRIGLPEADGTVPE